jgi:hypothetical protein
VAEVVTQERISLVCLQKTKLSVLDDSLVANICGSGFQYSFIPAIGTRGGILIAWHSSSWSKMQEDASSHALSLRLKHWALESLWWILVVYGPQGDNEMLLFLA